MGGGFKTRKIPRELLLDPPPRRWRWRFWLALAITIAVAVLLAVEARALMVSGAIAAASPGGHSTRDSHTEGRAMNELMIPTHYLEDLQVGQRFKSGTCTVDEAQIRAFAEAWDPQPFHLDSRAAGQSLFKGLVASGWHTAAMTMRLNVESGLPFADGIIALGGEIRWPTAARPGDVLRVESQVVDLVRSRANPGRGVATVESRTVNQRGEVVQVLRARLMVSARASR